MKMAVPLPPVWFLSLATIGMLYVSAMIFRLLSHLALCLRRPKDLRRRYGSWAVVTGPTSGIGRSMAHELARLGLNLVLVGRDPAKLRDVSDTISAAHGVRTRTVVLDLSLVSATAEGGEAMARLRDAVSDLDVGVLVNNAGVAKPGAVYTHEVDVEAWMRMIRVNLLALTEVTAAVLPGMARRGRGAVVSIGSASASILPSYPLYSVYASTKRYVAAFSRSLAVEYGGSGVDVQCQVVGLVETNMLSTAVKDSYLSWFVLTPDDYARSAVRWIGHGAVCVPGAAHRLQSLFADAYPEFVLDRMRLRMHLRQRDIFRRIRMLRKSQDGESTCADAAY